MYGDKRQIQVVNCKFQAVSSKVQFVRGKMSDITAIYYFLTFTFKF